METSKTKPKCREKVLSTDKKRKDAAERKRRERERIRQDPEKYAIKKEKEKERSRKRRESKKIKSIDDLSERGKRKQRGEWRKRYHRHAKKMRKQKDLEKYVEENSPPDSPASLNLPIEINNVVKAKKKTLKAGSRKKKLRQSREKYKKKIKHLQEKLEEQKRNTSKWKLKHHRLAKQQLATKNVPKKQKVGVIHKENPQNKRQLQSMSLRKVVQKFLTDDENSYSLPGRKDTITKKKFKMQKRYLSETLLILHKKFVTSKRMKISYSLFCRLKPFWVVHRPPNKRYTCMCKYHENFLFLFQTCKQYKVIRHTNVHDLVGSICCSEKKKACMYRECNVCNSSDLTFSQNPDVSLDSLVHHYEWKIIKEERVKNGTKKLVKVTRKVKVLCTLQELQNKLSCALFPFMAHMYRVFNQSRFSKHLRTNLRDNEVFVIVDFSENYQLKYKSEVQSRHFGASNEQVVLHTGVYFTKQLDSSEGSKNKVKVHTFCTVSTCNRHDAAAIWAHLLPILHKIKQDHSNITRVHIMSDGSTKQYRNKSNIFLFCYYMDHFGFTSASYNFSESGHGKSVADGVGGTIKRTADLAGQLGKDVSNLEEFLNSVQNLKPMILQVKEDEINNVDCILKSKSTLILPIFETMKLHQITWNYLDGMKVNCRYLSCKKCRRIASCTHQKTTNHNLLSTDLNSKTPPSSSSTTRIVEKVPRKLKFSEVYSDTDEDENVDDGPAKMPNDLSVGEFVLVKFPSAKNTVYKHYIGQVSEKYENGDYEVKCLRKKTEGKFIFPLVDDIASVELKDVFQVLTRIETHRGIYSFLDLAKVQNIN